MSEHLFLRACRRQPVDRTPVWMMRQAGRYLPAYRAVRARASFLELCRTPELACEVTLQPIDEFGFDAAILFSDILITLPPMGLEVAFPETGPKIATPVRTHAQIEALKVFDPEAELPYVMEAVRQIKRALANRVPLIGFAGAPLTMLTYAVEGGGSRTTRRPRSSCTGPRPRHMRSSTSWPGAARRTSRRRSPPASMPCRSSIAGAASCRRATSASIRCATPSA
jgi:uroporphyrinogen decarboxylase